MGVEIVKVSNSVRLSKCILFIVYLHALFQHRDIARVMMLSLLMHYAFFSVGTLAIFLHCQLRELCSY